MRSTRTAVSRHRAWAAATVLLVLVFGLQQLWLGQIELAEVQLQVAKLTQWAILEPATAASAFVLLYVLVATLSIPVAPLLSLAGGALFGWGLGLFLVLGARSVGATLAAGLVRLLFRARMQARHPASMQQFDAGVLRDGVWYLLSLRLLPVMPYVLVNVLGGLSALPLRRFFWISVLGMLPAAALQVLAGVQLAQLDSLRQLQPPWALLGMAALALLPLLWRIALRRREPVRPDKS